MPRPRRRRRFFAAGEGEYRFHFAGEKQHADDIGSVDSPEAGGSRAGEVAELEDTEGRQERLEEEHSALEADTSALPPAFQLLHSRRARLNKREPSRRVLVLTSLLSVLLGVFGGHYLIKPSAKALNVSANRFEQKKTPSVTPLDQEELDAAFETRHEGKLDEAEKLFDALVSKHPDWKTMEVEVARTQIYKGNFNGARATLNELIDHGSPAADTNLLIGLSYTSQKAFPDAERSFAAAVADDPTRPDGYYFWGECLRVEGKPLQATTMFRSALLRNQYETATGLYRLKLWLSVIESNQEGNDGTNAEIDSALAQPHPTMEAFFAAAARLAKASDFQGAAAQLQRARACVDPAVFHIILNDPFFAQFQRRPEFTEVFRPITPPSKPG